MPRGGRRVLPGADKVIKEVCLKANRLVAISLVVLIGCARGPTISHEGARVTESPLSLSDRREAEMGRQIHEAIVSSFRVYTEPRLVNYVNEIGRSIVNVAERKNLDYKFTVLYDDRAYATEAPGGYVYVTTGFIYFLRNEAELAAVLAHEVAALQDRDPRFSISKKVAEKVVQTGAIVGPLFGQIGMLAATAVVLLNALMESALPTPADRLFKADDKALRYLVEAGHDPQGYLDLQGQLLNLGPEWKPYFYDYLYSRPASLERYQAVLAEFEKLPLEGKSFSVNRDRYLEVTKGIQEIYRR